MKKAEKKYLKETENWTQKEWKKEMNLNNIKIGDKIEGIWYPFGYVSGIVEKNEQDLIIAKKYSIFNLDIAYSFRKVGI